MSCAWRLKQGEKNSSVIVWIYLFVWIYNNNNNFMVYYWKTINYYWHWQQNYNFFYPRMCSLLPHYLRMHVNQNYRRSNKNHQMKRSEFLFYFYQSMPTICMDITPRFVLQVRHQNEIWKEKYFFGHFLSADFWQKLWE